jgi:hypothetical protein
MLECSVIPLVARRATVAGWARDSLSPGCR